MRPKKNILLACANEERTSILRFFMETNGFSVTATPTSNEVLELASTRHFDLVVCVWPLVGVEDLLRQLHEIDDNSRSLVLAQSLYQAPVGLYANTVLTHGGCSPAMILDRVKLLSARKRGPRPARPIIQERMRRLG